jgi:hypothetical protein
LKRRTRRILLVVSAVGVFVATFSLIGAAVAARRARNDVRFGIEELDLLIDDRAFAEADAMTRWLAERAVTVGDGLRVYKRANTVFELTGSSELPAFVAAELLHEFPGNSVIRELAVYSAVVNGESVRALSFAKDSGEERVRPDYYALSLLATEQSAEIAGESDEEAQLEGPLLLTRLNRASDPTQYDAAWQLTQDRRYATNAALLYLAQDSFLRAEELIREAHVERGAPLFVYDYYLSRGDYESARRIARQAGGASLAGLLREADIALYASHRNEARRVYQEIAGLGLQPRELLINTAFLSQSRTTREGLVERALELFPDDWQVVEQAVRFFANFDPGRADDLLRRYEDGAYSQDVRLLSLRIDRNPTSRGYPARLWQLIEDNDDESAFRYAAWYFRSHGSRVDARQALNRSMEQFGRQYWIISYEGLLSAESGEWESAARLFTESHEMVPEWRTAYDAALAWYRAGWPQRGARMLERARQLATYSDERARAEVYTASARTAPDTGRARDYLKEALSIAPSSAEALYLLRTLGSSRQ